MEVMAIHLNDLIDPANGLATAVLRSRLHRIASKRLMILSWEGRLSGRRYSIPVGYQLDDDSVIVLISRPDSKTWWRNFRSPWPAELVIRGKTSSTTGVVIEPGSPEFYEHCETTLRRLPWMGSQLGGFKYDKTAGLTDDQRDTLTEHAAVVRFVPS